MVAEIYIVQSSHAASLSKDPNPPQKIVRPQPTPKKCDVFLLCIHLPWVGVGLQVFKEKCKENEHLYFRCLFGILAGLACLGWAGWLSWPEWLLTGLDDKVLQDFVQSCARD